MIDTKNKKQDTKNKRFLNAIWMEMAFKNLEDKKN